MELLEQIPLRRKTEDDQRDWDMQVVKEYFIENKPMKYVMKKFGIHSTQTLYNARNRVNKLIAKKQDKKEVNNDQ